MADAEKFDTLKSLIEEIKALAKAKHITVAEDITEKTLNIAKALPYETTSSMHTDLLNHKSVTELESLTGYVVKEAQKYKVPVPEYTRVYKGLKEKWEKSS